MLFGVYRSSEPVSPPCEGIQKSSLPQCCAAQLLQYADNPFFALFPVRQGFGWIYCNPKNTSKFCHNFDVLGLLRIPADIFRFHGSGFTSSDSCPTPIRPPTFDMVFIAHSLNTDQARCAACPAKYESRLSVLVSLRALVESDLKGLVLMALGNSMFPRIFSTTYPLQLIDSAQTLSRCSGAFAIETTPHACWTNTCFATLLYGAFLIRSTHGSYRRRDFSLPSQAPSNHFQLLKSRWLVVDASSRCRLLAWL